MNKLTIALFILTISWGCTQNSPSEKFQGKRNNVIDISKRVKKIETEALFGSMAIPYIINDYLIIEDIKSSDKLIHILNKNNYQYITSIGERGLGPGEIGNIGYIEIDEIKHEFYVTDHAKQCIFTYNIDSVLINPAYMPEIKIRIKERFFPDEYLLVNDTLSIGKIIKPTGNSGYNVCIAKVNMNTGEIEPLPYEHPEIKKKRVSLGLSLKDSVYIECYSHYDLITICDLNGHLKYNIYGPQWNKNTTKTGHYEDVMVCNNKIVASYLGEDTFSQDKDQGVLVNYPDKFLIFDTNGNYLQTLYIGHQIHRFCYDKDNKKIIMTLGDDMQFAYVDVDGIL